MDPHNFEKPDPYPHQSQKPGAVEARNGSTESWKICRPVVEDSHHLYEELDPDPHQSEKSDPDPFLSEKSDQNPDPHQSESDPQH